MNPLKQKTFEFSLQIIRLTRKLQEEQKEYVLSKQLLRSGTSPGALVMEAEHAESKADFIHKLAIAQKEINESIYWLELLTASNYLSEDETLPIKNLAIEILKITTASIKTAKSHLH